MWGAAFWAKAIRRLMCMVRIPPLARRAMAGRVERCSSKSEGARAYVICWRGKGLVFGGCLVYVVDDEHLDGDFIGFEFEA
jgi:hypothetical protein